MTARGGNPRFSVAEVRRLAAEGLCANAISQRLGVSTYSILYFADKLEIDIRRPCKERRDRLRDVRPDPLWWREIVAVVEGRAMQGAAR